MDEAEPPPLKTGWLDRFTRPLAPFFAGLDRRTAVILTLAAVVLLLFRKLGTPGFFRDLSTSLSSHPRADVFGDLWWFTSSFVFLGLIPFLALVRIGVRGEELGTGLGDWKFGLRWVLILYAIMLPVIVIASRTESFWRYYPINQ